MTELSARRPLYVIVAIALGALLLAGVWFASAQGGPGTGPADDAAQLAAQPGATDTGSDDPQAPGDPQAAPGGPKPPGSGQPPAAGQPGSPPAPDGAAPEPAAPGTALERVESPPERTLWALSPDSYDEGQQIAVRFEPYGTGPETFGPSIVARVVSATPQDPSARLPELAERNVIFIVDASTVSTGGMWEGTAVTRVHDDRLVFALREARPLKGE